MEPLIPLHLRNALVLFMANASRISGDILKLGLVNDGFVPIKYTAGVYTGIYAYVFIVTGDIYRRKKEVVIDNISTGGRKYIGSYAR